MVVLVAGFDSVTVKPSLDSTTVSPATLTVIVLLVSPAAKLTVPEGSAAPAKSDPAAGLAPLPVTAQLALVAMLVVAAARDREGERRTPRLTFHLVRTPAPRIDRLAWLGWLPHRCGSCHWRWPCRWSCW